MTVRPTTLNLKAVKKAPVDSVLTYRDSDCAGDADRFSLSETASWAAWQTWLVPDHCIEPKTVDDRTQQWRSWGWLLHFLELVKACRRMRHNRSLL